VDRNSRCVNAEWLGRAIGQGLLEGGRAQWCNLHRIVYGLGQAIGESCGGEDRLMLEVMLEDFDRGVAQSAGLPREERPRR
jgi:hypothetical protein